jgi:two-component system nitrate/nitrite response regulator NarL
VTQTKVQNSIGILLVDDHAMIRSALRLLIEKQPEMIIVGEASNREEALTLTASEQPEIILLDLYLGAESGMDLIPELLAVSEISRIIVLTAVTEDTIWRQAIQKGAMGVVCKEASADFLLRAIERVHLGELWLTRYATAKLVNELRRANQPKKPEPETDLASQLSAREREVVELVGEGLKNKQIADRLYISETTVRHHLTSILKKLHVSDRLELLIFAYRNNLVNIKQQHG